MAQKNTKFFIYAFGAGFTTNLILNIIFVSRLGIIAAAGSTLIAYFITALMMYAKSAQYIKFKVDFLFIAKSILASLLMSISIYLVNPIGSVKILLTVIGGAVVYFTVLFLLKAFASEEIKVLSLIFKASNFSEKY